MAGATFRRCPVCSLEYGEGRVLNAAEASIGIGDMRASACPSCLTISTFHYPAFDDRESPHEWTHRLLSGGGDTKRFLERIEEAATRGELREFHATARTSESDRWRLRLPEALPFLRPLYLDGGELAADTYGAPDTWHGCLVLESFERLPLRKEWVPDPDAPLERIANARLRSTMEFYPKGLRAKTPVFRKGAPAPRAVQLAICLMVGHPALDPGATYRLVAVPPDLLLPIG